MSDATDRRSVLPEAAQAKNWPRPPVVSVRSSRRPPVARPAACCGPEQPLRPRACYRHGHHVQRRRITASVSHRSYHSIMPGRIRARRWAVVVVGAITRDTVVMIRSRFRPRSVARSRRSAGAGRANRLESTSDSFVSDAAGSGAAAISYHRHRGQEHRPEQAASMNAAAEQIVVDEDRANVGTTSAGATSNPHSDVEQGGRRIGQPVPQRAPALCIRRRARRLRQLERQHHARVGRVESATVTSRSLAGR